MKKIAIILGSSRKDGNTLYLVDKLSSELEIQTKVYNLLDYNISYFDYEHLNKKDNFVKLSEELTEYTDLLFATPVYWYSMSAPMKTFFDRMTDLVTIRKDIGRSWRGKRTWLLASGTDQFLPEGFEVPFSRTSEYFDMNYSGSFYCKILEKGGEIKISDAEKLELRDFSIKITIS